MKRFIALSMMLLLLLPIPVFADASDIKVIMDGTYLTFDQPPVMQNDRVLVPLRVIFEALDAEVEWDEATSTVKSTKGDTVVIMQIGNSSFTVNGVEKTLDVPPQLIGSRTLVPVRAIAESFDCKVDWDDSNSTVIITSGVKITVSKNTITETVYKDTAAIADINAEYPELVCDDNSVAIDVINKNLESAVLADIEAFKTALLSDYMTYELEYGITNMGNNLVSVLFTTCITQDSTTNVSRFVEVYKLDTGEKAMLTDYFSGMTNDEIIAMFITNFNQVIMQEPDLYYENAAELVEIYIDYAVIYPCGKEIAVSFNPGVIAPYDLGFKTLTYSAEY